MATSTTASTIKNTTLPEDVSVSGMLRTVLPYALAIIVQLPLLVLYFKALHIRPHYSSWWPFALIATGALIWHRWPKDGRQVFMESLWSNILLVLGLVIGMAGVLFVEPWFAACSVFILLMSLMARTIDRDTGKGLWTTVLPLFVALQVPMNYDRALITWLQSSSAFLTSRLLDLVNIPHYMPGTTIQIPGKEYGIEEACSGIQSFFLLVFVAVVLCVWLRRTLFRSAILVTAAVVWSVFMNCIRIFLIPFADIHANVDLSHGIQHSLLGWFTMALGVLMLLSTDQFLMFLFGPVDPSASTSGPMGKFITNIWNNLISGKKEDEDTTKRRRSKRKPLSLVSRGLTWITAGVLAVGGLLALWDIKNSFEVPENSVSVNFFSSKVVYPLGESAMPEVVKDWRVVGNGYDRDERTRASDLGEKSDSWSFISPNRFYAIASFDQTFPGWHELTKCYTNQGWKLVNRTRYPVDTDSNAVDDDVLEWPYIEAHFEKETGERAMLVFSLFDGFGEAFDPPKTWGLFSQLVHRASGRIGHRARARLFQGEGYQTQVFVQGFGALSQEVQDEVTDHYLEIREIMRTEFLAVKTGKRNPSSDSSSETKPADDDVAGN